MVCSGLNVVRINTKNIYNMLKKKEKGPRCLRAHGRMGGVGVGTTYTNTFKLFRSIRPMVFLVINFFLVSV